MNLKLYKLYIQLVLLDIPRVFRGAPTHPQLGHKGHKTGTTLCYQVSKKPTFPVSKVKSSTHQRLRMLQRDSQINS